MIIYLKFYLAHSSNTTAENLHRNRKRVQGPKYGTQKEWLPEDCTVIYHVELVGLDQNQLSGASFRRQITAFVRILLI